MAILRVLVPLSLLVFLFAAGVSRARFKLKAHERLVVFRLGRPVDVRGPGTLMIIPFIETGVRLDSSDPFEAKRIASYEEQVESTA